MDPQSRPAEFSAARGSGLRRTGIPGTLPPRRTGLRRVHFPRAESRDRSGSTGDEPGGLPVGAPGSLPVRRGEPVPDRGTAGRFEACRPSGRVRTGETGQPCLPTARTRSGWLGRAPRTGLRRVCRHSTRPVLKHGPRSLTCARVIGSYETQRRSESEGGPRGRPGGIPGGESRTGAPPSRPDRVGGGAEIERARWDPKDGELCLSRKKPEETLVEVRSDSDVQIDRQTWV